MSDKQFQKKFDYEKAPVLLDVRHIKEYFDFKGPNSKYLKAVHDVSFKVYKGEVFGLVGESGCGKTTTGRCIMKLYDLTSGDIWLDGIRISAGTRWNEKEIKYTNLRAQKAMKDLEDEKKKLFSDFKEQYKNVFKSDWNYLKFQLERKKPSDPNSFVPKEKMYQDYLDKIKPIDDKEEAVRKHAEDIVNIQRDKIRSAKKDNREYNKNIAREAVKEVETKYASILSKVNNGDPSTLSPEELTEYNQYKEDLNRAKHANIANKVQMIFQDPIASLDPRMTVRSIISEGLVIQGCHNKEYINEEVAKVLTMVGLVPEHANRYPHEFSGGQRQRIGIARAIIMHPELIVADEPVSALDVSVQAQVINLLNDLRNNLGLTLIFIAHNLSVVKYFCDRIAVMYYGNLVELTTSEELFKHPLHPYTRSLLSAVPYPDPIIESTRTRVVYDPVSAHDYSLEKPSFIEIVPGHFVSCNSAEKEKYLEELKSDETPSV